MKDEFTPSVHASMLEVDGWTKDDVSILSAWALVLRGTPKDIASRDNGISVDFYNANIERVKNYKNKRDYGKTKRNKKQYGRVPDFPSRR